jgi:hypothetical protein
VNISAFLAASLVPEELKRTCAYSQCDSNSTAQGQEIPCPLLNQNVHYRVLNSPTTKPILSHMNPVPILSFDSFTICFRIILQFTPESSLHIFLQKKISISFLSKACYMPTHLILLCLIVVIYGDQHTLRSSSLCRFPQFPVNSTAPCSQGH